MKRLYRSRTDRKIAGIFGGLGELYEVDPNLLRLLAVLVFLISGFFPVLVTYVVAWIIIPEGKPENVTVSGSGEVSPAKKRTSGKKPATNNA
jgi:phage shock protein C